MAAMEEDKEDRVNWGMRAAWSGAKNLKFKVTLVFSSQPRQFSFSSHENACKNSSNRHNFEGAAFP
jgi:hypothetical protein